MKSRGPYYVACHPRNRRKGLDQNKHTVVYMHIEKLLIHFIFIVYMVSYLFPDTVNSMLDSEHKILLYKSYSIWPQNERMSFHKCLFTNQASL